MKICVIEKEKKTVNKVRRLKASRKTAYFSLHTLRKRIGLSQTDSKNSF